MPTKSVTIEPAILYLGTPVVLISTQNEDGSHNLAPMSSAWWLGWRCFVGLGMDSKTPQNMIRTGECVLNLPSVHQAAAVDRLARLTGSDPVPPVKQYMGYAHERHKFTTAGMTATAAETVNAVRAAECPVQLEAVLVAQHPVMADMEGMSGFVGAFELRVTRVHVHADILMDGFDNRIDPDKWRPLIMSFQKFYGLTPQVHPSRLAEIPETLYRSPDVDRAREEFALQARPAQ